jgi:glycosyltransferase involved in cell wall biosynthesis
MKRICFALPAAGSHPIGGFKIVYQYANGLARRGYQVSIVHTCSSRPRFVQRAKSVVLDYVKQSVTAGWRPDGWFPLDPTIRLHWIPTLRPVFLPKADIYVATWWYTAERLAKWKTNARRLYLIQHLETWGGPEARVLATWKAPLEKIVIARWLAEIATKVGERAVYIPNGLDFEQFGIDAPIEGRNPRRVAMLYHNAEWKGSKDGLQALELLKQRYPDLQVELFGVPERSPQLPDWIAYHRNPPQRELRELYNRASIFLAPSWTEGWSLPPAEAMMSGVAVVATDIGGHREYCTDRQTALFVPPQDPHGLADATSTLLEDEALRRAIARAGNDNIRQFTWKRALSAFEGVLMEAPQIRMSTYKEQRQRAIAG